MEIGSRIRFLRQKRGMEQLELAQKLNISQSKMNKIETGFQKRIEPEILSDLAKALNTTVDYLVNGESEDKKQMIINKIATEFPDADLMFKDLANMSAEQLEEVYDFIKFKIQKGD